jgi:hypothetical protein
VFITDLLSGGLNVCPVVPGFYKISQLDCCSSSISLATAASSSMSPIWLREWKQATSDA